MTNIFFRFQTHLLIVLTAAVLLAAPVQALGQEDDPLAGAVAAFNRGQDLHEKNDLKGAINQYRHALTLLPEFPEAAYQMAIAQLALGQTPDAESSFRRAVELRSGWSLAMNGLASVLLLSDDPDKLAEARKLLDDILDNDPKNPPALAALAELSVRTKASETELKELWGQLLPLTTSANPTAALMTARASVEYALGQKDWAEKSVAKALAIDPDHRNALLLAADIAIVSGDLDRAKALAKSLERGRPDAVSTVLLNANILAAEGKVDEALALIDKIEPPTAASTAQKNKLVAASSIKPADLEKQLATDPRNVNTLNRLCTLYRLDSPQKAVDYCRRAAEIEPDKVEHAVGLGAALVQARQLEQAVAVLKKVIEKAPDNSTARANLATALYKLKRYPEAKTEFQWLAKARPSAPTAYFFLGIIHDHLGEYLDAVANYQLYLKYSDPVADREDIDRVNLRMPALQKFVKKAGSKRN